MSVPQSLQSQVLDLSHRYGGDSAFVLAGGGNTSFKSADKLWVKASGHALATIGPDGFVELDRPQLDAMLGGDWPADSAEREALFLKRVMAARTQPEKNQRPSVEALLHHLLPDGLVVHTHPGLVNALTCCTDGQRLTREWFGDDVLWQPYVDPGLLLAQALQASVREHQSKTGKRPAAIFLQNHGLIVAGESAAAIEATSKNIVGGIATKLATGPLQAPPVDAAKLSAASAAVRSARPGLFVAQDASPGSAWVAGSAPGKSAALAGPLTPDQIVYCRSVPLWIDGDLAADQFDGLWNAYVAAHHFEPWVAVVAGAGVLAFRDSPKLADTTSGVYADAAAVSRDAHRLGGVHAMQPHHRQFIEQWEVEAYRRSVAAKG